MNFSFGFNFIIIIPKAMKLSNQMNFINFMICMKVINLVKG